MSNSFFNHTNRFVKLDTVRAEDVNAAFDGVSAGLDDVEALTNAALKLQPGETPAALPAAGTRANKVLTFDASGNPVATITTGDVTTVAGSMANVNTVGANIADVNTVAGNTANINTVAGIDANVTTVAGIAANVTTVAGDIAAVQTVAADLNEPVSEIETVAGSIANVDAVGANIANVNSVATNIASVNTAASNIAAIIDAPSQASAAAASASAAAASLDSFDDRYLGSKASDPTLDNDGNALLTGALYWNSAANQMRVWNGSAWEVSYLPASSYVTGTASSVDGEIVLFDGATGKATKRATTTGVLKATSGVVAAATAGTDYVAPGTATNFTKPQRPSLQTETAPSSNAITWDLTDDTVYQLNLNANVTTFNLTGTLAALLGYQYQLIVRYNGGTTITWNSNFKWPGGTAPTLTGTSGKIDIFNFTVCSTDGGTTAYLVNTGKSQNMGA